MYCIVLYCMHIYVCVVCTYGCVYACMYILYFIVSYCIKCIIVYMHCMYGMCICMYVLNCMCNNVCIYVYCIVLHVFYILYVWHASMYNVVCVFVVHYLDGSLAVLQVLQFDGCWLGFIQ